MRLYLTKCPHCGYVCAGYADLITVMLDCPVDRSRDIHGCGQSYPLTRANAIRARWKKS